MPVRSRPDVVFMSRWFDDDTRGVDGRDTCSRGPVAELDDDEREAFEVYVAAFGSSRDDSTIFDNFREAYCGKWSNEEEYAEQLAEDCCMLEGAPEFLKSYFDYKAFARDLFIDDYYFDSGFVFRRM